MKIRPASLRSLAMPLALSVSALLAACGGGGYDDGGVPPAPEDTVPAGARIDVSALDLYPLDAGDDWRYDRFDAAGRLSGSVQRSIVSGPDASGWFVLRESDAGTVTDSVLRMTSEGVEQFDPLGAQNRIPGVFAALPSALQYPMPFYAPGGVRRVVRQGDARADLDGDGYSDAFRLEITQVFRGFETQDVLGAPTQVAHFGNGLAFTVYYSARGGSTYTTTTTEEAYLASGLGLVRADRSATGSDGAVIVAPYTLLLRDAHIAPLP